MFIYSVKAGTLKFAGIIAAAIFALVLVIFLVPDYAASNMTAAAAEIQAGISFDKVKTESDRVKFLEQFGWEVGGEAIESEEIVLPDEFDRVMRSYNELQKSQGFNLEKYKGKTLTRYTYEIKNYPDYDGTVFANVIVYKNRVVGGDVCSSDVHGFISGFVMPAEVTH